MRAGSVAIGADFGTEGARVIAVGVDDGRLLAVAEAPFSTGVVTQRLPDGRSLGADWALHDPLDYRQALARAIPEVLKRAGISPDVVAAVGIDATACSLLPVDRDGRALAELSPWRSHPHAWIKLWKHHSARLAAQSVQDVLATADPMLLARYGGAISAEWALPKALEIYQEDREVFEASDRIVEVADWLVFLLTGQWTRNVQAAAYKGLWQPDRGWPVWLWQHLNPQLAAGLAHRWRGVLAPPATVAGVVSESAAAEVGLRPGTPVASGLIDAHAAVYGSGVTAPGAMVLVMGTSTCHLVLHAEARAVPGIFGMAKDAVLPGLYAYEAGQSATGDLLLWLARLLGGSDPIFALQTLSRQAVRLRAGQCGLLALDWWNGNRSVLRDDGLAGSWVGLTLDSDAVALYRALWEATGFSTRRIVEAFSEAGVACDQLIACGGLAQHNPALVQVYADIVGRPVTVAAAPQASALGAALAAAVAAGCHPDLRTATGAMVPEPLATMEPRWGEHAVYEELYQLFSRLHDAMGKVHAQIFYRLRELKATAAAPPSAG